MLEIIEVSLLYFLIHIILHQTLRKDSEEITIQPL